jgi:putative ABC transport system permease protein
MAITQAETSTMKAPAGPPIWNRLPPSAETSERAALQIESILRERHRTPPGRDPDFVIHTQKEFQALQESIYGLLTVLLVLVAALSSGAEAFAPASSFGGLRMARSAVCAETRPFSIRPAAARSAAE